MRKRTTNQFERYPNGYLDKINYYQFRIIQAIEELNLEDLRFHTDKLEYFMQKELERTGRLEELLD
jgi:hypothetical protein